MRRLAALLVLAALPVPARAATPVPTTTWVVERVAKSATALTVRGGAGAREHEWAMAAVAAASVDRDGKFTYAEGGLFFGAVAESVRARTPAGSVTCEDVSAANPVCLEDFGAGIGFAIAWTDVTFNRAFVVLRGRDASIDLGEHGSPGWRARRWYGPVRVVTGDDASVDAPLGASAGGFTKAEAVGGPGGSVAIGHLPCRSIGYTNTGSGAVRLIGGVTEAIGTCADWAPPAAFKPGSTEWTYSGAAAGVSDVPARLVVIERPLR